MKIDLRNLSFEPKNKSVFTGLNYCFESGIKYLIQGASGCGKSSLLRFISSLDDASSGEILINDHKIDDYCEYRKNCQWLSQTPHIYNLSVKENLEMALNYHQMDPPNTEDLTCLIKQLFPEGLDLDTNAMALSGGQKHRLALLRAILLQPQALLCDEISAGLDELSRKLSEEFIFRYCEKMTVIFVSHIKESFAGKMNITTLNMTSKELREI
ncbi:ATP-binding cassette domain-containing protein [Lentisphaera profundi]|uniref:ATP-binding cassette domain-containing protein n=1 Tax=Lentisphaera profundi TaxID=1658616 RepID=A0ABY7VRF6_9BACT|nr:ATP-binding cassette domain-containing protein [Lentisphaera profundi]WDE96304.1 ATP-binding cassette domain-containing protein [Lentisphaera profundi]